MLVFAVTVLGIGFVLLLLILLSCNKKEPYHSKAKNAYRALKNGGWDDGI